MAKNIANIIREDSTLDFLTDMTESFFNTTLLDIEAETGITDRVKTLSAYLPILGLQIAMGLVAIAVNLLVLCVFILGRVNNSLSYLLCNLAVANIMLGLALSTRSAIEIMDEDVGYTVQFICHITMMTAIMNMGTCITTILCLCSNNISHDSQHLTLYI